jgi:hypothetical protein
MSVSLFQEYWARFSNKSAKEREEYFSSLSKEAQRKLVRSFFEDGWHELFIHNIVADHLDFIKQTYNVDLLDLRIKALKGRVVIVERKIWDHAKELVGPYSAYYRMDTLFGGLKIQPWGRLQQFYLIKRSNAG